MTREAFIRKWLANKNFQYCEEGRAEMREDLDKVIDYHANNKAEELLELLKESLYEKPQNEMQEGAQIVMKSLIARLEPKGKIYSKDELKTFLQSLSPLTPKQDD